LLKTERSDVTQWRRGSKGRLAQGRCAAGGGTAFRFRSMGPLLGPSGGPFGNPRARKLRRVNGRVDGYEPGGRRFESCRARQTTEVYSGHIGKVDSID